MLAVELAPQQPMLDKHLQAVGEDVRGDAGAALDVGKTPATEQHVAHDQERPTLADKRERSGDRAVLVGEGTIGHAPIVAELVAF